MPLSWPALHAQLLALTTRHSFVTTTSKVLDRVWTRAGHSTPHALVTWFQGEGATRAEKNRALAGLIRVAQTGGRPADCAQTLILLSLWPGLDAVRNRLRRHYRHATCDLDAEIIGRAAIGIGTLDLARVDRIAATLIRNVERDIRRSLATSWRRSGEEISDEDAPELMAEPLRLDDRRDLDRALARLSAMDAAFLIAVVVEGLSQVEAAERFGMSAEAGRKRFQRACARLRKVVDEDVSRSGSGAGVSSLSTAKRGARRRP